MTVLGWFPRWLRRLLLGANLAGSVAALAANWSGTYSNLIASWVLAAAAGAIAIPVTGWLGRKLPQWQEHIARRAAEHTAAHLTEHHDATRTHVTEALAQHAAAQTERLAVITDQIAALHARLDQQGGGAT